MKRAKRIFSLLLSLCLVLGLFPSTAFAASGNPPFTDVNTSDWYYNAVQYAYEKGMMNGTSTTTFSPNDTTTRGMIVTILHRMEGTPAAVGTTFTDVPTGQWYSDAVSWANANGIVGGYGNSLFGPGDPITREQMAAILNRYSQHKGYDTGASGSIAGFSDASQVSSYAVEPMGWAIGNGLISGTGNNTLAPKGNATRAQVATILMRFCENVAGKGNSTPTPDVPETPASKTYTVTFDLNYGSDTRYDVKTVKEGETVGKPSNPSRSGYSFGGWYAEKSGGRQFDFKTGITSDLTLYAHWSSNSSGGGGGGGYIPPVTTYYTVTFDANGGTASNDSLRIESGSAIGTLPTAAWEGHTFLGWYTAVSGGTQVTAATTITGNITLYAHWQADDGMYRVWFLESDGTTPANTEPNPQTVVPGNRAFSQQAVKAGNAFVGWYTDRELTNAYDFDTAVVADINLYAKWLPAENDVRITIDTGNYEETVFNRKFNVKVETTISSVAEVQYTLTGSAENLLADETLATDVGTGSFTYSDIDVLLDRGTNTFTVIVTTSDGNEVRETVTVTYDDGSIFSFGSIEEYEAAGTAMIPVYEEEGDEEPVFYVMANIIRLFFTEDSTTAQREAAVAPIGEKVGSLSATDLWQVRLPEDITDKERLTYDEYYELIAEVDERYAVEGSIIESAELDEFYIAEEMEYVSNDGWDSNHDDWWLTYIDADDAWEYDNHYNSDYLTRITVGVVDGGFLATHNDLNGNIRLLASDYNVADSHGTHVAGIIGAMANNGEGGAGVTHNTGASRNSTIVAYDAGDGNGGYSKDSLQLGLNRTVAAGAKVINFSIGSSPSCNDTDRSGNHSTDDSYSKAMGKLLEKGSDFVVVQSAGNGDKINGYNAHGIAYWGVNSLFRAINTDNCYHSAKISKEDIMGRILIASNVKDNTGVLNITSNGYATNGDRRDLNVIAAPGTNIYSSIATGNSAYASYNGTSMAAPVVTGVCSMVWSVNKKMTGKDVVDMVMNTTQGTARTNTTDTASGATSHASGGMGIVNAKKAVEEAIKTLPRQQSNVIDATTGRGIPGAKIVIKNSRGQVVGNGTGTIYAAQDGSFTTFDWGLPAGSYTLTVSAEGYVDTVVPWRITNLYPHRVVTYPNILLSTEMDANNYRIILTWGDAPRDLDSHLVADADTGDAVHVYYSNKNPNPHYVNLDVDDTTSYGPETITITNFGGLRNIRYAVHDYTNRSQSFSMAMAMSGASVQIYKGNTLLRTYRVPLLAMGTVWEVFGFDASGNIVPINRMSYCRNPSAVLGGSDVQLLEAEETPLKDYEIAELEVPEESEVPEEPEVPEDNEESDSPEEGAEIENAEPQEPEVSDVTGEFDGQDEGTTIEDSKLPDGTDNFEPVQE